MARKRFAQLVTILIAVTVCTSPAVAQISPSLFPPVNTRPQSASVQAESTAESQGDKPRPFPEPDAAEAEKLDKFLTDWQMNGATIKTVQMKVILWSYQNSFRTAHQAKTGEMYASRIYVGNLKLDTENRNFDFTIDHRWEFQGIDQKTDEPKYSQKNQQSKCLRFGEPIFEYDFSQRTISDIRPLLDQQNLGWLSIDSERIKPEETLISSGFHSARPTGLEPATTGSTVRYSNQLSYGPKFAVVLILVAVNETWSLCFKTYDCEVNTREKQDPLGWFQFQNFILLNALLQAGFECQKGVCAARLSLDFRKRQE